MMETSKDESYIKLWRHDGVIHLVMAPELVVLALAGLIPYHHKWSCHVFSELADLVTDADIKKVAGEQATEMIRMELEMFKKGHGPIDVNRFQLGTEDFLPGYIYGTMHPVELVSIGLHAQYTAPPPPETPIEAVYNAFIVGQKNLTRDNEKMAAMDSSHPEAGVS
jgi:hypothetical protein